MKSKFSVRGVNYESIVNHKRLAILLLSITGLVMGCKPSAEVVPDETAVNVAKVSKDNRTATASAKDASVASKSEFVRQMRGELAAINKEMDLLAVKIDKASVAAKAAAKPRLQVLRDQAASLKTRLDEVANSTEATWGAMKTGIQEGYEGLKEGFDQMAQAAGEKAAP